MKVALAALLGAGTAIMLMAGVLLFHGANRSPLPLTEGTSSAIVATEGVVEPPSKEIALAAPITGTIESIAVVPGQHMSKGQVVATLRSDDLASQLFTARGDLAARQAALDKLEHGARIEERARAAAANRGSLAEVRIANLRLSRIQALAERGFATQASLDEAIYGAAAAVARRDQTEQDLTLINAPPRPEDVAIARADVRVAQSQIANAAAQLDKALVRAPIDGTILSVPALAGEATSVLQPTVIATMGDLNVLHVAAEVDEDAIGLIRLGQPARVTTNAFPGQNFWGTVIRIDNRMMRKPTMTADPQALQDALTLKVTVALSAGVHLPVGLRCDVVIDTAVHIPRYPV